MKRRILLLGFFAGLSGCSILPDRPPLKLYTLLNDVTPVKKATTERKLSSIRINSPMIAGPYDSTRCYVLGNQNRVYGTEINRFSASPGILIGEALRSYIEAEGPWKIVLSPNTLSASNYQLTAYLPKFYIDATKKPAQAIVEMEVSVIKGNSGKLVFHKTYLATSQVEEENMAGAVTGLDKSLKKIFSELVSDLNQNERRM